MVYIREERKRKVEAKRGDTFKYSCVNNISGGIMKAGYELGEYYIMVSKDIKIVELKKFINMDYNLYNKGGEYVILLKKRIW